MAKAAIYNILNISTSDVIKISSNINPNTYRINASVFTSESSKLQYDQKIISYYSEGVNTGSISTVTWLLNNVEDQRRELIYYETGDLLGSLLSVKTYKNSELIETKTLIYDTSNNIVGIVKS